jgi:hypothetical protein
VRSTKKKEEARKYREENPYRSRDYEDEDEYYYDPYDVPHSERGH